MVPVNSRVPYQVGHTPGLIGVPGRHRTSNLLGKNQRLCRLSYRDKVNGRGGWIRTTGSAVPNGGVWPLTYTPR